MIKIENFTKIIKGKSILDNINYTFEEGTIYGLYGRNGSGKTMLLRAVAGLIFPSEGKIIFDGKVLHKDISFPPSVGVIIENTHLLPQYDAFTNLKILAKIRNIATDEDIKKALEIVGLDPESKEKVKTYSLGLQQKLAIAQAIFEFPKLLLLDEPTNALDEKSVQVIRNVLLDFKEKGTTIIIASHNKEDITFLSDIVIGVDNGKIKERVLARKHLLATCEECFVDNQDDCECR